MSSSKVVGRRPSTESVRVKTPNECDVFFVGGTQSFHGLLHSHEAGILAGTTN